MSLVTKISTIPKKKPEGQGERSKFQRIWLDKAAKVVLQNPIFETRASLRSFQATRHFKPPKMVFVGIGVCTRWNVSRALPFDALGLLLAAEHLRRETAALKIVVVVADEHARSNRLHQKNVDHRVQKYLSLLTLISKNLFNNQLYILRASSFHKLDGYQNTLRSVSLQAPDGEHPYFKREVADIEFLNQKFGGIVKVGWAIDSSMTTNPKHDELAFDQRFRLWRGNYIPFVYCKAGRSFDMEQPKVSPYVELDPSKRICLMPEENIWHKFAHAKKTTDFNMFRAVRNHLKATMRVYCQLFEAIKGPVEYRAQRLLEKIFTK